MVLAADLQASYDKLDHYSKSVVDREKLIGLNLLREAMGVSISYLLLVYTSYWVAERKSARQSGTYER